MNEAKKKTRRGYGSELKQPILAQCSDPGASVVSIALSHGINANVVHKWRRQGFSRAACPAGSRIRCVCTCTGQTLLRFNISQRGEARPFWPRHPLVDLAGKTPCPAQVDPVLEGDACALCSPSRLVAATCSISTTLCYCHKNAPWRSIPSQRRHSCSASRMMGMPKVENSGKVETTPMAAASNRNLLETLATPYLPVTLARPMRMGRTALGLEPRVAGVPSDDYLANFFFGRRSFKAVVRSIFQTEFHNLANYAKGRNSSPEVRQRLLSLASGEETLLTIYAATCSESGASVSLAHALRAAEGLLYKLMRVVIALEAPCPCCGGNLVTPAKVWWSVQAIKLGDAETEFVDRILNLPVAFATLGHLTSFQVASMAELKALLAAGSSPVRNWLQMVMDAYRAANLANLAARAGARSTETATLYRLKDGDALTFEVIEDLIRGLLMTNPPRAKELRIAGRTARVLSFVVDLLQSAHAGSHRLDESAAQEIVYQRVIQLDHDIRLVLAAHTGRLEPTSRTSTHEA